MALITCPECKKQVSSEANFCPHCGFRNLAFAPATPAPTYTWQILGGLFLGVILVVFLVSVFGGPSAAERAKSDADKEHADIACKASLQCMGDKYGIQASAVCKHLLEAEAKSIAKWDYKIGTDSMFDMIFPRFRWGDQSHSKIMYLGDEAKFQNGFGAWERVSYQCLFDVGTEKAIMAEFTKAK